MVENFNNNKDTDTNKNYNKTFSKFLEPNKNDKSQNLFGTIIDDHYFSARFTKKLSEEEWQKYDLPF